MPNKALGTIWVCTDCLMADQSEYPYPTDREPWSAIEGGASVVTIGLLTPEHEQDCPAYRGGEFTGRECFGCETQDFSWSRCDGCGSTLGGERHAYTLHVE